MYLLGIDIGTSACKAAAFTLTGELAAKAAKSYPVSYPQQGWAQQDARVWFRAAADAVREITQKIDAAQIVGVGVDGQSWSCIPVDKNGQVLADTPIWTDTRAASQCEWLDREIGREAIYAVCKNPMQPTYTTPKVLWFKDVCPEIYQRTACFLQSNSYIVYRLTGRLSQDRSQGYGHFFYDMHKECYDASLAAAMGLNLSLFPELYDCDTVVGKVLSEAASLTGLKEGTPVVAGGLDAACAALGAGVFEPYCTQEQGGQAGGMSICVDAPLGHEKLILGSHVVRGRWLLQGGTTGGGGAIKWFSELFGAAFGDSEQLLHIDKAAQTVEAGSEGLIFLPYLAGERSPVWNPKARGVYFGLTYDKTRAHMARATMEGVCYSLLHNLETAREAGAVVTRMRAVGGSANSAVWTQMKADVTGIPIDVPYADEAATLGAALLAGVGTGVYRDYAEAVQKTVTIRASYLPNRQKEAVYRKGYQNYLDLYEHVKELMI